MPADHHHSANQHEGARRLLTAGLTVLLLALAVIMGISVSPSPLARGAAALEVLGGGQPPGVAVEDAAGAVALLRSASFATPTRSQPFGLGGCNPDDGQRIVGLPSLVGFDGPGAAVVRQSDLHGHHWAASGQLTRRKPTGPPSILSLAS